MKLETSASGPKTVGTHHDCVRERGAALRTGPDL